MSLSFLFIIWPVLDIFKRQTLYERSTSLGENTVGAKAGRAERNAAVEERRKEASLVRRILSLTTEVEPYYRSYQPHKAGKSDLEELLHPYPKFPANHSAYECCSEL